MQEKNGVKTTQAATVRNQQARKMDADEHETSKQRTIISEGKEMVFNREKKEKSSWFSFSTIRIFIGTSLAVLFIFKDLFSIILFGILRLLTETLRWLVNCTIRTTQELTTAFVRVILHGIQELLDVVVGIIVQIAGSGSEVVICRIRQIIGLITYSFIACTFAVVCIFHRIMSLLFSDR